MTHPLYSSSAAAHAITCGSHLRQVAATPKWRATFETFTGKSFSETKERTRCVAVASGLQEIVRAGCTLPTCNPEHSCATCAQRPDGTQSCLPPRLAVRWAACVRLTLSRVCSRLQVLLIPSSCNDTREREGGEKVRENSRAKIYSVQALHNLLVPARTCMLVPART